MTTDNQVIEIPAEWEAAYDNLYAQFGREWETFPSRRLYRQLVRGQYMQGYREREVESMSIQEYVQRRFAARERLGGPIGPITVVRRPMDVGH